MPGIIVPQRWRQQPQGVGAVEWGHPLAGNLRALQSGGLVQFFNGATFRISPSVVGLTPEGRAPAFVDGQSVSSISQAYPGDDGTRCTIELLIRWTSGTSGDRELLRYGPNAAQQIRGIWARGTPRKIHLGNFGADMDSGVSFDQSGALQHIVVTFGSAVPTLFYVNGQLVASKASVPVLSSTTCNAGFGASDGNFTSGSASMIKSSYYNRALSAAEVASLAANPWQLFKPIPARTWALMTGGGPILIGATQPAAWTVRNAVSASQAMAWSVRAAVDATLGTAWSVRASVAATASAAWTVRGYVTGSQAAAWSVRNAIAATQALAWSVLSSTTIQATQAMGWTVRNTAAGAQATAWSVRTLATGSQTSAWSVRMSVSATRSASWSVRNAVQATQGAAWRVAGYVVGTQAVSWTVGDVVPVEVTETARYRARAAAAFNGLGHHGASDAVSIAIARRRLTR